MCDQLEEAAQQLTFFCEVQESLGNTAVKSWNITISAVWLTLHISTHLVLELVSLLHV